MKVFALLLLFSGVVVAQQQRAEKFLSLGDTSLANGDYRNAIDAYNQGIDLLDQDATLITAISLYTNLGTAFASNENSKDAILAYRAGMRTFEQNIEDIEDDSAKKECQLTAAQASFFLGMEYQDSHQFQRAADAYSLANTLDPYHWAALSNLGSVLQDHLEEIDNALIVYNKAIEILTQRDVEPTDAPTRPEIAVAELQYRVGLCLTKNPNRKCAMTTDPSKEVPCQELATNAFSRAVNLNPDHHLAKHMLATITADATMLRADNKYVKSLFDDYAENFEHSLVDELGYDGYARLRRAFDRAFKGDPPKFPLVVDAGCGTGLVGEQFRNISTTLVGVDLSASIIEEANKKRPGLYDQTVVGDITEVFRDKAPVSLIVAADSYIYFGDLDPLFQSMEDGLANNGFAAFTLENADPENEEILTKNKPDWRWQLTASGRFAHRKSYVVQMGLKHRLQVYHYETLDKFRYEMGKPVYGHAFIMKRLPRDQEL